MTAMKESGPHAIHLKDYRAPDYSIDQIDLRMALYEDFAHVTARTQIHRRGRGTAPLVLHGEELELKNISIDGRPLAQRAYRVDATSLTLHAPPARFSLEIVTIIKPQENTSLEGLYKSSTMFCTQCEAEGFRKITYYLDRPDVMARFTTQIIADRDRYPVLLSNGDRIGAGELPGNRHWAQWEDPYPKPAYLFAMVAGDLERYDARHVTASGRRIDLRMYVESGNLDKCEHAMVSLKQAMTWDEERFGLEYDLDTYMIVAVGDFNMGAMENKGLNIFNTSCVFANPKTATDMDFARVQNVVGHEYFHNWTGNRVTCRDWFQLSLKEGLTVFRDQEFSADMGSAAVQRIDDVRMLRSFQFPEDAGPMAHPVRPDAYIEISNFYTATVYSKGAEVVRMLQTLVGRAGFRRGMDLYFRRHDGQAVTTDDFVNAMADANHQDLRQFKRWYRQAGTPRLEIDGHYDAQSGTYTLHVVQSCAATPGQEKKQPFHIPLAVALVDNKGKDLPLRLAGERRAAKTGTRVLDVRKARESFRFVGVTTPPTPSLLRNFSAPVVLQTDLGDAALAFLLAHDSDPFNRWEAGQQLAVRIAQRLMADFRADRPMILDAGFVDAMHRVLTGRLDPALVGEALSLPSETYLAELVDQVDVEAIHHVREFMRRELAAALQSDLLATYDRLAGATGYRFNTRAVGRRRLKNLCLSYLMDLDDPAVVDRSQDQFVRADNMTDELAAFIALANKDCPQRAEAIEAFYTKWQAEPLVLDKWFATQAMSRLVETRSRVHELAKHPAFEIKNPNKVRALIGAFARANPIHFHAPNGSGYQFVADHALHIDTMNPQVAARLVGAFSQWQRYDPARRKLMRAQLERIRNAPGLSKDSYEIASKSLGKTG